MGDLIEDRSETIRMVAAVMRDINSLTVDIREQTQLQGSKLEKVDEELAGAADNVELAND